jgi:hypothetical protein
MPTLLSLPAELQLNILENCDGFQTLYGLVNSCSEIRELFKAHSSPIYTAIFSNYSPHIQRLISGTILWLCKSQGEQIHIRLQYHLELYLRPGNMVLGVPFWSSQNAKPLRILHALAAMEAENNFVVASFVRSAMDDVNSVIEAAPNTEWCLPRTQIPRHCSKVPIKVIPLSNDISCTERYRLIRALWRLRFYTAVKRHCPLKSRLYTFCRVMSFWEEEEMWTVASFIGSMFSENDPCTTDTHIPSIDPLNLRKHGFFQDQEVRKRYSPYLQLDRRTAISQKLRADSSIAKNPNLAMDALTPRLPYSTRRTRREREHMLAHRKMGLSIWDAERFKAWGWTVKDAGVTFRRDEIYQWQKMAASYIAYKRWGRWLLKSMNHASNCTYPLYILD